LGTIGTHGECPIHACITERRNLVPEGAGGDVVKPDHYFKYVASTSTSSEHTIVRYVAYQTGASERPRPRGGDAGDLGELYGDTRIQGNVGVALDIKRATDPRPIGLPADDVSVEAVNLNALGARGCSACAPKVVVNYVRALRY